MNKHIYLQRPDVGDDELKLVKEVLISKNLVEGKMVRAFERVVSEYIGIDHAIACTSATTGLELALRSIGIQLGDEVIIPDFTHPATGLVIYTLLGYPVLIDVDLRTANTTASLIEQAITPKTKAIIPVSLFGNPLEIGDILDVARKYGLPVIEDAACSLGSKWHDIPVGSMADISVFSLHPRKILTTGDGGIITTNNTELAAKIQVMKRFGIIDGEFVEWGTNYRMSDILGAVALGQLQRFNEIIDIRKLCAKRYDELLKNVDGIKLLNIPLYAKSNYQTYCIYIESEKRDIIITKMKSFGIEVQIGTYALHKLPIFKAAKKVNNLFNSSKLYEHLLALPLHHGLTLKDQVYIISTLKGLL